MSRRISQPAAPANTIVTTFFPLEFRCLASVGRPIRPSHPLGDFEDEPAENGEAQTPKKHHDDHRQALYFLQDDYDLSAEWQVTNC
jgi:hypothetical protein